MNDSYHTSTRSGAIVRYMWVLALAWTLVVAGLLAWNFSQARNTSREIATAEARAYFDKDQAFRFWATLHGGVYVPTDERTLPNPYLVHIPERDIETPSGVRLTLMNPAYMIRQMNEKFASLYGVAGHITILKPLRPENAPDDWERAALDAFEREETEVSEFTEINGEPYLRLMQPMITQEGCLKCHSHQGYQVGDVRGGVGVSLPMAPLLVKERRTIATQALSLGLLWILGLGGLGLGSRGLIRRVQERDRAEEKLGQYREHLEEMVEERTAELEEEITERVRAEEALRESGERLELAITGSNGGQWHYALDPDDPSHALPDEVYFSPRLKGFIGYEDDEFPNSLAAWGSRILPKDLAVLQKISQDHRKGQIDVYEAEYRIRHKDGSIRWIHSRGKVQRDEQGRPIRFAGIDWDITERKRAEEALRQESRRAEGLRRIGEAINSTLDLDTLLQTVVDEAQTLIGADYTEMHFGEVHAGEGEDRFTKVLYSGFDPATCTVKIKPSLEGINGEIFRTQKPLRLDDRTRHPHSVPLPEGHLEIGPLLGVPILVGGRCVADILLTRLPGSRPFTEADELAAMTIANQAAVAIQNTQLYQATQQELAERKRAEWALGERVKEITCLYAVSRDMQEDLSIDELCRRVVEHLVPAMQFPEITVPVIELDGKRFTSERYTEGLSHGLQAEIRVRDEAHGQMWVYYAEGRPFLIPEEQNLVNGVAEALGRWFERKQAEEEIRLLQTMTRAISESQDYGSALEMALQKVCQATGWSYGEAWIPRSDGAVLECGPVWYDNTRDLERFRQLSEQTTFPPDTGLPGRVWSSKRPEWLQDVSSEPDTVFLRASMALEVGLKAGFGVPIISDGQVLAVLVFSMFEPRQEDTRLIELVSVVAAQLGAVIHRKRMEEALRESEEQYRLLFNSGNDAVFVSRLAGEGKPGEFIAVNDVACQRLDYSRKELLAISPLDISAPENLDNVPAIMEELFSKKRVLFETKHLTKDGRRIPVEINSRLFELGGRPAILSIARDVTERKLAEEALAWESKVNATMAKVSSALISPVSLADTSSLILDHAKQLTGSEFGFVGHVDPQTGYLVSPTLTQDIWDVCQVEDTAIVFEKRMGLWGWVLENRQPLLTNNPADDPRSLGVPQGHIPIQRFLSAPALIGEELVGQVALANPGRDYTEQDLALVERLASLYAIAIQRTRAEDELLKLSQAVEQSANTVVITDLDGNIEYANPKFEETTGYTVAEALGQNPRVLKSGEHPQSYYRELWETIKSGQEWSGEFHNQRKDGTLYWEQATIAPVYDAAGQMTHFIAVKEDITARKQAEEALQRYVREQEALYAIASAAASSLDPDALLSTVLDTVLPVLDSKTGWVELPGPTLDDPPRIIAHRGVSDEFVMAEESLPLRDCPVCAPLLEGGETQTEPMLCTECSRLPHEILDGAGLHSHVGIPLSAGDEALGILNVGWSAACPYTEAERTLLMAIGQQVGLALQNAQLYQQARQVDRLRALNELDRALAATLDPEEVVEITLQQIAAAVDAPMGALFTLSAQAGARSVQTFSLNRGRIEIAASEQEAHRLQVFLRRVQEQREIIPFSGADLRTFSDHHGIAERWGPHGLLVPAFSDERLIAVLALGGRPAGQPFTDEDRALTQAAAARAGQSIQNARLHQTTMEAEARYRELYHGVPVGLYRTTPEGQFLVANRAMIQILGYPDEEALLATGAADLYIDAEDRRRWQALMEREGEVRGFELQLCRYDGSVLWVQDNTRAVRDESGRVAYYEGSLVDVTERRQAEEALREAEQRYRTVADFTYDWEYWESPDGTLRYVSPSCERITGYPAERFMADPRLLDELIVPEDREIWAGHHHDTKNLESQRIQFRIRGRDGETRWIEHLCQPVVDEQGAFLGYRASNRDATARKRAEDELRQSEAGLAEAQRIARLGNWDWDILTNELWWSDEVYRIFGLAPQEFRATYDAFLEAVHPDDRELVTRSVNQALREGQPYSIDHRVVLPDGSERVVHEQAKATFDESGQPLRMVGTVQCVTERVQAEQALRKSEERFRKRSDELGALYQVSLRLNAQLETSELLALIVEQTVSLLGAEAGCFYIHEPQRDELIVSIATSRFRDLVGVSLRPGEGLSGKAFESRRVMVIADYGDWPGRAAVYEGDSRFKATLAVPLLGKDGVLGVLNVGGGERKSVFDEHDVWLTELLAAQATVALENARLYRAVQERVERLAALNAISAAAVSSLDLDTVLHQILQRACQTLDAVEGSILLRDPDTEELFFATTLADETSNLLGQRLSPGQGVAGWVAQRGQPVRVNDVRQDARFYTGVDAATGFETRSLLCAPLSHRGEVNGVIEVVNKREGEFSDEDLGLLEAISSIAATALNNARLYRATRSYADKMVTLNEIGLALASTLDYAAVVHAALSQTHRLFDADTVALLQPDPQTGELYFARALSEAGPIEIPVRLQPGEGIAGWALERGQPVLVEDAQTDPRRPTRVDHPLWSHTRALMVVPLATPERAIGAIIVANSESGVYSRDELNTLQAIASALTVALENARLYDELEILLREREQAQAQLVHSEKMSALGRLVASLAHEINNPLQSVQGCLALVEVEMNGQQRREKLDRYLDISMSEIKRISAIVRRMRDFYRPDWGGLLVNLCNLCPEKNVW